MIIKTGRLVLSIALLFIGLCTSDTAQAADINFAYVDVPRVMASSKASKQATELLKKTLAIKQKEVTSMKADITKMKKDLEERKNVMTHEARNELANKIRRKFREFQRLIEDNQAAVDRKNRLWTKKLTEALREVIEEIGREKKYTAIFSRGQTIFTAPDIEITEQVLIQLDKKTNDWFK
ncbi:MAG: OmpH family outer membrane protein [Magnetococcales bacterium]|nr:OmpH family outer membrane protein [Magnetococcales bacterium]